MRTIVENYLWSTFLPDIDNERLFKTSLNVEKEILSRYPYTEVGYGCPTSFYHEEYNLFSFPCTELHKLYTGLSKLTSNLIQDQVYIRCWVNLFKKDKNIEWHQHFDPRFKAYHGFYCVNTEDVPSYTEYEIPGVPPITINSKNGLLVVGKSEGDSHRSSVWKGVTRPRVTIAFDIVSVSRLRVAEDFRGLIMHNFIPLARL